MRIGILGAGGIARKMAHTVNNMDNMTLAAIGSRNIDKAKEFAQEFSIPTAYGSYEELAADSSLDLIYVATPHSRHYEDALLCLDNGRNVLCEKPFTANARQAEELIALAESKGLFIGEAIWTRYLPMRFTLDEIMTSGVIGTPSYLTADLGYQISHVERLIKPELAGGALLDLGVYTINFALMAFGNDVKEIISSCNKNEYGVDTNNSIIMNFADGKTAMLHSNLNALTDLRGMIYGDKGRIEFENINNCEGITVYLNDGTVTRYDTPPQITGFEYQVQAAADAIAAGKTECPQMPHSEILRVQRIMTDLRSEWRIHYPFE
ncbi:MAG: Gfo/Idh/MocA family oxidoreductase [Oscillospiraceae bacterium]|nr:Gfo/Idh/MocA family oxidoreductase [Oscillospiraceae bacterium]